MACGGGDGDTTSTSTSSSSSSSSSSGDTTSSSSSGGGSGGTGGTGGHGGQGGSAPTKPADCVDLSLTGIELLSQQENTFDSSDSVPVVRTPSSVANISGNAEQFDRLRILFDGKTGVGVHALDPEPNHVLPDYQKTYLPTCSAGAVYQEDRDSATSTYTKLFAAKAGELEITELVTPHQTAGAVRYVELREVAADADTGAYAWVSGGACYWIQEAKYDVRRDNGCLPFVPGSCPADKFCMPTNAIGSDGECVTGGTKGPGEACTLADDTHWSSDCQLGLRCLDSEGSAKCYEVCDVVSTAPGCPAGTHCGGGYNLCLDEATVLANSGVDDAAVGEACATNPTALYCGGAGQPGTCYDDDGDAGPKPSTCIPWMSAPSQCIAPQTAGYVAYKNGSDNSTLWCLTPP
ncbi:putative lipoprotein [Minicystis rosea]|nr:putative lipoprotein [Minicystis rosea]